MKRVVIIGSGLGGLSCGALLSKKGFGVTVLEQGQQIGGCLQCFTRRGAKFETGMHFIGSAREGEALDGMLEVLGLKGRLPLAELDRTGYDVIAIAGERFRLSNGREAFVDTLAQRFPHQRTQLEHYMDLVGQIGQASALRSMDDAASNAALNTKYQLQSVNAVIDGLTSDPLLAKVLVGNLPLYAGERDKTPFAMHAFIMDFYNHSAFRIVGGSDQIAVVLKHTLESNGGQVFTRQKATHILCDAERATAVVTATGERYEADWVISDAHPMRTLELIDSKLIRPAFRNRINSMPQTIGAFSVYVEFKPQAVPYMNHNYYAYADSPWGCEDYNDTNWPKGFLYMHFCDCAHPVYAHTGVIISYMKASDVAPWVGTTVGHRGDDYEAFKQWHAERLIEAVAEHFPGFRECIKHYYTSTPLTYRDYTGAEGGGMYGVARDMHLGAAGRVTHRMKIPNILQTGQNINSHGMLGVLVGTLVTCNEIVSRTRP